MTKLIDEYLSEPRHLKRLKILETMRSSKSFLPVSLVKDLWALALPREEKQALLWSLEASDNDVLESFLIGLVKHPDQNIATTALEVWVERTNTLLWQTIKDNITTTLPQRLRYRLVELSEYTGGIDLINYFTNDPNLTDYSAAFHNILLQKALFFGLESQVLTSLARDYVQFHLNPHDKQAFANSCLYLACYEPSVFTERASWRFSSPWGELIASLSKPWSQPQPKLRALKHPVDSLDKLAKYWPHTPKRPQLKSQQLADYLRYLVNIMEHNTLDHASICSLLSGFHRESLLTAITHQPINKGTVDLISQLFPLFTYPSDSDPRFINWLNDSFSQHDEYVSRLHPRVQQIIGKYPKPVPTSKNKLSSRAEFFLTVTGSHKNLDIEQPSTQNNYWQILTKAWHAPELTDLDDLAQKARKQPYIWQAAYIQTLGRFEKNDKAVLKLLEYIRSDEYLELVSVIDALAQINSPRATQELIHLLTRPNVNNDLKVYIADKLIDLDVSQLQSELRSAINDLQEHPDTRDPIWDVKERLATLLEPQPTTPRTPNDPTLTRQANDTELSIETGALDEALKSRIARYQELSSEVKRALRTAEFFYGQVGKSQSDVAIDLSPVVDMQYKALELLFREFFEVPCKRIIESGILQRKLDVLGYARPIEEKMHEFENYIAHLPKISEIPFFSKFKLRKLLRAICQYRPGRRFTLDGLKAFGLFFLVFGRKNDRFGMGHLITLPFEHDEDLYELCYALHIFQDIRNRAAHEGFHPEAAHEVDTIWQYTQQIIDQSFLIKENTKWPELNEPITGSKKRRVFNNQQPAKIITKKVS